MWAIALIGIAFVLYLYFIDLVMKRRDSQPVIRARVLRRLTGNADMGALGPNIYRKINKRYK